MMFICISNLYIDRLEFSNGVNGSANKMRIIIHTAYHFWPVQIVVSIDFSLLLLKTWGQRWTLAISNHFHPIQFDQWQWLRCRRAKFPPLFVFLSDEFPWKIQRHDRKMTTTPVHSCRSKRPDLNRNELKTIPINNKLCWLKIGCDGAAPSRLVFTTNFSTYINANAKFFISFIWYEDLKQLHFDWILHIRCVESKSFDSEACASVHSDLWITEFDLFQAISNSVRCCTEHSDRQMQAEFKRICY